MNPFLFRLCLFYVLMFFASMSAFASMPTQSAANEGSPTSHMEYYIAIKGGVSLGSYESGINRVILKYLGDRKKNANGIRVSFSGASAGSINSLLSAIEPCLPASSDNMNNLMFQTWDIGINDLLGNERGKDVGLFSRKSLEGKIKEIKARISDAYKQGQIQSCHSLITLSITRVVPFKYPLTNTKQTVNIQRFVVPIVVAAEPGGEIRFSNYRIQSPENKAKQLISGPFLALPEEKGSVPFDRVAEVALASSAFPIAFQPMEIEYCIDLDITGQRCEKAAFSDGGMFDNSPVGVVVALMNSNWSSDSKNDKVMFFINPDHYRPNIKKIEKDELKLPVGLGDYAGYFLNSFSTATSTELKNGLVDIEIGGAGSAKIIPIVTTRYTNLLADFTEHFGAFYAKDFRTHDYLVGIYDGFRALAEIDCHDSTEDKERCIQYRMQKQLDGQAENFSKDKRHLSFLHYLYNKEYVTDLPLGGSYKTKKDKSVTRIDNIYVALAESFGSSSKQEAKSISFREYINNLRNLVDEKDSQYYGLLPKDNSSEDQKDLRELVYSYRSWRADNYKNIYSNVKELQRVTSGNGNKLNNITESIIVHAEPIVASVFAFQETDGWPLAYTPKYRLLENNSASILVGYDYFEYAPQITAAGRYKRERPILGMDVSRFSWDYSGTFHRLPKRRANDHYFSVATGPTCHQASIIVPTFSVGLEHSFRGQKSYDEPTNAVYLSVGLLNEIVSLKYSHRVGNMKEESVREVNQWVLQADITKLLDMWI